MNQYHLDLGVRKSGAPVADVDLPPWALSAADFTGMFAVIDVFILH